MLNSVDNGNESLVVSGIGVKQNFLQLGCLV